MNASEGIQFIEDMERQGIKPEAAKRIVSLVESQQGELATKADLEQVERRLEASIDQLKEGQNEQRKANRWAIGIIVAAMIGGFTLQGMYIIAQISDLKADYRQTQPADQQPTDQTSASGRS